ncbi:hypothetical protein [Paenibacillus montanisoli]|uniref:Uncharacterized protein n=1 Tax=Paenibacillus montanisoli TaxID=2081970 RepID=A0A328U3A7_9BACL|nr:hypothetical protein [Paenibacillus montanisoli]RAP74386.1 hypothetical protein DL346_20100 [Paenibacillus montanisoli]
MESLPWEKHYIEYGMFKIWTNYDRARNVIVIHHSQDGCGYTPDAHNGRPGRLKGLNAMGPMGAWHSSYWGANDPDECYDPDLEDDVYVAYGIRPIDVYHCTHCLEKEHDRKYEEAMASRVLEVEGYFKGNRSNIIPFPRLGWD